MIEVRNKKGCSPMWLASNGGHLDVCVALQKHGGDVHAEDNRRVSCLLTALKQGHVSVVRWLVRFVKRFPSDSEMTKVLKSVKLDQLKSCQECMGFIEQAKSKQAEEASANAQTLLKELEEEKSRGESKRLAKEVKKGKGSHVKPQIEPDPQRSKSSTELRLTPEAMQVLPQHVKIVREEEVVVISNKSAKKKKKKGGKGQARNEGVSEEPKHSIVPQFSPVEYKPTTLSHHETNNNKKKGSLHHDDKENSCNNNVKGGKEAGSAAAKKSEKAVLKVNPVKAVVEESRSGRSVTTANKQNDKKKVDRTGIEEKKEERLHGKEEVIRSSTSSQVKKVILNDGHHRMISQTSRRSDRLLLRVL
jgi:hypothetical protein